MTVLFGASQSGIGLIRDLQTGFLQRILASPASTFAVLGGKLLADVLRLLAQALFVLLVARALGARFEQKQVRGNVDVHTRLRAVDREEDPETAHALDRIRRCGRASAPALAELVGSASERARVLAAGELALVAPAEAVPVLLDAIPKVGEAIRRELRTALSHAAKSDRAAGTSVAPKVVTRRNA